MEQSKEKKASDFFIINNQFNGNYYFLKSI